MSVAAPERDMGHCGDGQRSGRLRCGNARRTHLSANGLRGVAADDD